MNRYPFQLYCCHRAGHAAAHFAHCQQARTAGCAQRHVHSHQRHKGKRGADRNAAEPNGGRGRGRNAADRFVPKGYGNVGCYDEEKYLNEGRPLNGKFSRNGHAQQGRGNNTPQGRSNNANANIRDAVAAARAELRNQKDLGAGFFKDKKKKSFNPNFDTDNHNRKNRYNSGDKNERGSGRGNQGRNEGRGRRK